MYICEVNTPNFTFVAAGNTPNEALDAMIKGWTRHCKQTGADIDYFDEADCAEYELNAGECLRDREHITAAG